MRKIFLFCVLIFIIFLTIDSISYKRNYSNTIQIYEQYKEEIDGHINKTRHMDVFMKQDDYLKNGVTVIVQFLYPLLLIVTGCFVFHKKIHSGFFKHVILREKYSKFISNEVLRSWGAVSLIPIFMLLSFLFSCFVTNFNFELTDFTFNETTRTVATELFELFTKTINLLIISMACINVGLIFVRKNKNFMISVTLSYLFIVVYQVVCAIIVGPLLSNVFHDTFFANGTTLFSFWYYDSGVTFLKMFVYAILLLTITLITLKHTYKNKESVMIDAEK